MRYHRKILYGCMLLLTLSTNNIFAVSPYELTDLHHQRLALLKQCLQKPEHDWRFGPHRFLSYKLPQSSCTLIVDGKHKNIVAAKLMDKHGANVTPSQCPSPVLICLGINS